MAEALIASCRGREDRLAGGRTPPEPIPRDRYGRIVEALAELGTWDRLEFHGGRVVAGDLVSLRVGARDYRRPELWDRSGRGPIRVRWTRNRAWGMLQAVAGLGTLGSLRLGNARIPLSADDTVLFHEVGDREPTPRRLVELDRIVLG
jgi:hypothetical protein